MDKIVVGVDGSTPSDTALSWAAEQARSSDATLRLVYAFVRRPSERDGDDHARADAALAAIADRFGDALDGVTWHARAQSAGRGSPAHVLMDEAQDADLIVVGSRGLGGFAGLLLGSTSYRLATLSPTPVVVVRSTRDGGSPAGGFPQGIVVGVDGSASGDRALRWAAREARRREVPLDVVHAEPLPTHQIFGMGAVPDMDRQRQTITEAGARIIDGALTRTEHAVSGVQINRRALVEPPAQSLATFSGERLVVIGNRGHSYVGGLLLGSVSHHVLHHADGPVVVVP